MKYVENKTTVPMVNGSINLKDHTKSKYSILGLIEGMTRSNAFNEATAVQYTDMMHAMFSIELYRKFINNSAITAFIIEDGYIDKDDLLAMGLSNDTVYEDCVILLLLHSFNIFAPRLNDSIYKDAFTELYDADEFILIDNYRHIAILDILIRLGISPARIKAMKYFSDIAKDVAYGICNLEAKVENNTTKNCNAIWHRCIAYNYNNIAGAIININHILRMANVNVMKLNNQF